jgi:penicillin-binding protein 2
LAGGPDIEDPVRQIGITKVKRVREQRDSLLRRLPVLKIAVAAAMVVVVGSYWFVQVVQGDYYRELAENNRLKKIAVEAARGLIFDHEGRLLVENVPSYNLLLEVRRSRDVARSLKFAAGILDRPESELEAVLERHRAAVPFRPILVAEDLTLSDVASFSASALEHPEFEIGVSHLRLYRYGRITAHALGHLGRASEADLRRVERPYRAGDLVGKSGVEQSYDLDLKGRDGERVVIVDSRGRLREEHDDVPTSRTRPGRPSRSTPARERFSLCSRLPPSIPICFLGGWIRKPGVGWSTTRGTRYRIDPSRTPIHPARSSRS